MTKKRDNCLCWNCEGAVSLHNSQCPYCGAGLSHSDLLLVKTAPPEGFENPFADVSKPSPTTLSEPPPPYSKAFSAAKPKSSPHTQPINAYDIDNPTHSSSEEETLSETKEPKSSNSALIFLLPGTALFLFSVMLILMSSNGVITFEWKQSTAYLYLTASLPMLYAGWRALTQL